MRICLYTDTALPKVGGQEGVVDALARHYQALGHEVAVLAPRPRSPCQAHDAALPYRMVRHPRFFSSRYFVSFYRWWLLRLHKTWRFDLLHCHGVYPPAYLAALTRSRLRLPVVLTSHGGDIFANSVRLAKPIVLKRTRAALAAVDALVAISSFTEAGYRRLCPQASAIVRIPNGVELDRCSLPAPRPQVLQADVEPGRYALFLGRLTKRKGVDVLLQAMALVPATGSVQLVVAGDGVERIALEQQCRALGLQERVCFLGNVAHPAKEYLLQNAMCTVVASRFWEAFPLVVLESYAAGTPVLASEVPGLVDLVGVDQTGWRFPENDSGALADTLRKLFANPQIADTIRDRCRRIAEDHSWESVARKHLELYERLRAARQPMPCLA